MILLTQIDKIIDEIGSLNEREQQVLLHILFERYKKEYPIKFIKTIVCNYYGITIQQINSKSRLQHIALTRQIIMYIARKQKFSFPAIGIDCGGRNHATVIYGCKKIEKLILSNSKIKADIDNIRKIIMPFQN